MVAHLVCGNVWRENFFESKDICMGEFLLQSEKLFFLPEWVGID